VAKSFHHPTVDQISLDRVLHALSDPLRREIVARLIDAPMVNCRTTGCNIAPSTLSFHYRILREAGLVYSEKNGTEVLNTLRLKDVDKRFPRLVRNIIKYHDPLFTPPAKSNKRSFS
jgi:DNA-binding transcriptional ArsR family regulator